MEILELKNITEMKLNKHAQRRMEGTEEQISEPEDREREFIQPEQQRRQAETRQYPEPSVQFSSVAQSCPTLCDPMDGSTPCFSVYHQLPELAQTRVHQVGDAIQPSHALSSLVLLSSIFPSIRVFSNESALRNRWPKYRSCSFSISLSNEYLGLISFMID